MRYCLSLKIVYVFIILGSCVCHSACVGIRGQLLGVSTFLSPCGFEDWTWLIQAQWPLLESHLMVLRYIFVFLCFSIIASFIFYDPFFILCIFHILSLCLSHLCFPAFQDFLHLLNSAVTSSPFIALLCSHSHTYCVMQATVWELLFALVRLSWDVGTLDKLLSLKPPYFENLLPLINSDMWKDTNVFVYVSDIAHSRHYLFLAFWDMVSLYSSGWP